MTGADDRPAVGVTAGELARATGITVRALHHQDQLGLLRPGRDRAGRRRYGPSELRRLHQIVALRSFGLALAEIGPLLDGTGADPVTCCGVSCGGPKNSWPRWNSCAARCWGWSRPGRR